MDKKCKQSKAGFTLIELLVVIVIIGVIGTIAGGYFMKEPDKARVKAAAASMTSLGNQLERFRLDMGRYPSEEEGLIVLIQAPENDDGSWGGKYVTKNKDLRDPWGNDFVYKSPASNGDDYEIISLGADGSEGGEDFNTDLSSIDE
ncbi:type II secretion system major pseudopilin GspG [Pontiellaceae bacterium B12227]|nr:type II secretion system major pseudopilin GspG [Pontiellaceae bacterium B12227]